MLQSISDRKFFPLNVCSKFKMPIRSTIRFGALISDRQLTPFFVRYLSPMDISDSDSLRIWASSSHLDLTYSTPCGNGSTSDRINFTIKFLYWSGDHCCWIWCTSNLWMAWRSVSSQVLRASFVDQFRAYLRDFSCSILQGIPIIGFYEDLPDVIPLMFTIIFTKFHWSHMSWYSYS